MKTWTNQKVSVLTLAQIEKWCKDNSMIAHTFNVSKVTANRVYVEYSNPDEYGNDHPMTAVFPCYPNTAQPLISDEENNPYVVLDILNIIHDYKDGEGWQNFQELLDADGSKLNPNE